MKIYKYYKGEVHELEVKETEKMYIAIERDIGLAFGCVTRFSKADHPPLSPLEAIRERINQHVSFRQTLKDRIHKIDSDMGILRKLERAYSQKQGQ